MKHLYSCYCSTFNMQLLLKCIPRLTACILLTLPTYVNKACTTTHIITVYVPFFIHPLHAIFTHPLHAILLAMHENLTSLFSLSTSLQCLHYNIYTHRKEKVNECCIALTHAMERMKNEKVCLTMAQLVGKAYVSSLPAANKTDQNKNSFKRQTETRNGIVPFSCVFLSLQHSYV